MVYLGVKSSGAAKKRPNGRRYRRVRASFLARNPLCAVCFERGLTVAAAEVHHTRPVKDHPDLFWVVEHWQALCGSCHAEITADSQRAQFWGMDMQGNLV